jgi:hypothetical protein
MMLLLLFTNVSTLCYYYDYYFNVNFNFLCVIIIGHTHIQFFTLGKYFVTLNFK